MPALVQRRQFLQTALAAVGTIAAQPLATAEPAAAEKAKTNFQLACMTLPYQAFPLPRALSGIKEAGFKYVAWGTSHRGDDGKNIPVMPADAPVEQARDLAARCRDLGLEPLMMFSGIYPEAKTGLEVITHRLKQAAAAKIPQVLTFGHTEGGQRDVWVERFRKLGPIARDCGVLLVVKQHGGKTGTGEACAQIVREVNDPGVWVNYDAGNVMDYLDVDPLPDIKQCADTVRSFCLKDHRNWPKDEDCAPGFGQIDHYQLLAPVAHTGLTMPLCFENIFAPAVPRPKEAEGIDRLARRAREFMETVIAGLENSGAAVK